MTATGAFDLPTWKAVEDELDDSSARTELPSADTFFQLVVERSELKPVTGFDEVNFRFEELVFLRHRDEAEQLLRSWLPYGLELEKTGANSMTGRDVDSLARFFGYCANYELLPLTNRIYLLSSKGFGELAAAEGQTNQLDDFLSEYGVVVEALRHDDLELLDQACQLVTKKRVNLPPSVEHEIEFKDLWQHLENDDEEVLAQNFEALFRAISDSNFSRLEKFLLYEALLNVGAYLGPGQVLSCIDESFRQANSFADQTFKIAHSMFCLDLIAELPGNENRLRETAILAGLCTYFDELGGEQKVALAFRVAYGYEKLEKLGDAAKWFLCAADAAHRLSDEANYVAELEARLAAARIFLELKLYERAVRVCKRIVKLFEITLEYPWVGWEAAVEATVIMVLAEGLSLKEHPAGFSPNNHKQKPTLELLDVLSMQARRLMERSPREKLERAEYWSVYLDDRLAYLYELNGESDKAAKYARYAEIGWQKINASHENI